LNSGLRFGIWPPLSLSAVVWTLSSSVGSAGCGGELESESGSVPVPDARGGAGGSTVVDARSETDARADSGEDVAAGGKDATAPDAPAMDAADAVTDGGCQPLDPLLPCGCSPADFFVEISVRGETLTLKEPFLLHLYCAEETPVAANNGCNDVIRVSGCTGPANEPPCFYLAASPTLGFFLGSFVEGADTRPLSTGAIFVERTADDAREGTLRARVAGDAGSLEIAGKFRACAAPRPAR
jgi:hypothetical protein